MKKGRILYRLFSAFVLALMLAMQCAPVAYAYVDAQNRAQAEAVRAAQAAAQAAARAEAARQYKAKMDTAQAEAQLMEALNAYLNMPADAPLPVRLEREAAVERAAQLVQEVARAQQSAAKTPATAGDAGVTARRDAGLFVWNSADLADANPPAGSTGWTVVGRPQGNRAVFERTFNEYVSNAMKSTQPEQAAAPRIYDMASPGVEEAAPTCNACAANTPAEAPAATFAAWDSPAIIRPCVAPRATLAAEWNTNLIQGGDFETWPGNTAPWIIAGGGGFDRAASCLDGRSGAELNNKGDWAEFYQDIDLSSKADAIDGGLVKWIGSGRFGLVRGLGDIFVTYIFEPGGDEVRFNAKEDRPSDCYYKDNAISRYVPAGTRWVRIKVQMYVDTYWGQGQPVSVDSMGFRLDPSEAVADLSATLTDSPDPVPAGEPIVYTATIVNGGPAVATRSTLSITLPPGTTGIVARSGSCAISGVTLRCTVLNLPVGGNEQIIIDAFAPPDPVAPPDPETVTASASTTLSAPQRDENPTNNSASTTTIVMPKANAYVTLTSPRAVSYLPGATTTYQIPAIIGSRGPHTVPVRFAFTPAANTTLSDLNAGAGTCDVDAATCDLGNLAKDATVPVTVTVSVGEGAAEGDMLTASADVELLGMTFEMEPDDNSVTAGSRLTLWDVPIGMSTPGGAVHALAFVNDALYAGGVFGVRRWDGAAWHEVGSGGPTGVVYSLYADGAGGLYAGGNFTNIGPRLAHWDGSAWQSVGGGLPGGTVYALTLLDNDLYVGGQFTQTATLTDVNNIALWDGAAWAGVGLVGITRGYPGAPPVVRALAAGHGKVYVGGTFSTPGPNVVAWNPALRVWEALGGGVDFTPLGGATVRSLAVLGNRVYVGGPFSSVDAGAMDVTAIVAWDVDAARWTTVGQGLSGMGVVAVNALAVASEGALLAAGVFAGSGSTTVRRIAQWNGASWAPLGGGINDGASNALAVNPATREVAVGDNFTGLDGMADPETPWVTAHGVGLYRYRPTDLAITLTASLDAPTAGRNYSYTLGVINQGDIAHEVIARLDLPEGVSFVSGNNCAAAGEGGVACTLGTLANGASASVDVNVLMGREARGELPAYAAVGAREWEVAPADNHAVYTVTAFTKADLRVTLNGPAAGVAGETLLVYDATVANDGPALAFNAALTFTFSGGIATYNGVSGFTCETVDNYADRVTVVCPLGDMEAGVSKTGQFSFTVGAATRGTLQGVLLAGSEAVDPDTTNNEATAATAVQARADVQVEVSAPTLLYLAPAASSELNYRLVVKHGAGPSTAQDVVLTFALPAAVVFASADAGCRYETAEHRVVCELEELTLGATAAFGVRVVVPTGLSHGTVLAAQATVASDAQDSVPANNTAAAQTRITTDRADIQANLKLTQQAAPVIAGTTVFYTLNVYNQGAVAATRFIITNTLPAGVAFDPAYSDFACAETATPGVVVCALGALDVGQSRAVVVAASVAPDTAPGTSLTNQAIVRGTPGDRDLGDNTAAAGALVTASADLKVTQSGSHTTVDAGDLVTFTVTVVNRGPSRAQAVTVTNTPPTGLVLNSATPSQGTCATAGGVTCDLGDLPLNATATVAITMKAGVGDVVNTVNVTAATPDPLPDNNAADAALTIVGGGPQTRAFGLIKVTADTFIDLPNGDVQAFGNIRLGEHYYLAGRSDSLIIYPDKTRFRGEGTVALREGEYPLFTGYFHGLFKKTITQGGKGVEVAQLYPADDVEYKIRSLGELDIEDSVVNTYSIYTVTLTSGQAEGSNAHVIAQPRGMGKIAMVLPTFFVRPGEGQPVFGGQAEPFSFALAGISTTVKTAEIRSDGMFASAVMTLPWGGLTAELNNLLITRDSLESLDVTVNLPNMYLVGQPLTKTVTVTTTKTITDAAGITSTVTITSTKIEDDGAPCRLDEEGKPVSTDTTIAVLDPSISLVYAGGGFTFVGKGRLCTVVPENVNDTAISFSIDTKGNFKAQADLIKLNIATAKLTMKDIAVSNDGLSVAEATLILPPDLMTATVTLQDVAINKNGLQLGGAAFSLTLPDVAFGDVVRFVQPVATIKVEGINTPTPRYAFGIDSMLHINLPSNAQKLRVMAEIDTTGKFKGSVQGISLTIASAILQIGKISFDNTGLSADVATLKLPESLGGVSGKLNKIRIDQNGLTVEGGAVKFPIPTFSIGGVFTFKNATAEIEIARDKTYKLTVAATVAFVVKDFGAEVTGYITVDSTGKVTGGLNSFTLTIVGLSLKVKDVKFQDDMLYIAEASLELPKALSGLAVAVYNVRIGRNGISIGGGKFQLPEIKVGGLTLGGLYAEFREEGSGYIIGAGGSFTIPGLGTSSGCGLRVALVIYVEKSTGLMVVEIYPAEEKPELAALALDSAAGASRVALRELSVGLYGCPIPVGTTGLSITRLAGSIKISREGVVTLELGATIATKLDLIKGDVDQKIQFNPFRMDLVGAVTVLYFIKAAEMKARISADPFVFSAEIKINLIIIHGRAFINIWTQGREFFLTGGATLTFGIPKNCILGFLPPWDIILFEIGAEFGKFVIDDHNNTAWGIKGWLVFLGWRIAGYIDTAGNLATGGDVDKYKLATPPQLARLRRLQAMLSNPDGPYMLSNAERAELAAHMAAELSDYTFADDHVIIRQQVASETQVMFALTRPLSQTVPTLRLRSPSGLVITPEFQPGDVTYSYLETPDDAGSDEPPTALMMYVVPNAEVGEWEAILDGISGVPGEGDYQFGVAVSFPVPTINNPWAVNTGPTSARAEWELSGGNPVTTTLDVYVTSGPITATHTYTDAEGQLVSVEKPQYSGSLVAQNVPTSYDGTRSSVDLDLSHLPSGTYWVWFRVNDWRFPPTNVYAPAPVVVTHEWQDTWTANLKATTDIKPSDAITWTPEMLARLTYRALEVTWTPNPNPDAFNYRLYIGREPDVVDIDIELGQLPEPYSYYLENLEPGQVYYLQLAAEDPRNGRVALSEQIAAFAEGMNYELTADQTEFELVAGESADFSLSLTINTDPAPAVVFFPETTLPDGIGLTLPDANTALTPTAAGLNIPVTLRTGESMVEGVYDVPIVAMSEGVRRELTLRVTVHEPRVYVTATPDTVILGQEETQIVTLSAVGTYGKDTPVYLNLEGFPAGLVYSLSEGSIRPGETVTLTFRDTWLLEPGTYRMQLRAGDGLMVERVPITLTVVKPFFTLASDLTGMAILAGENVAFPVQVTASGLSAPLRLEVDEWSTPLPNGRVGLATAPNRAPNVALDLAPDSNGEVNRTVYLLAETAETTPPGPYVLRIQGTDGVRTQPLTFDLRVYDRNTQVTDLGITQHVAEIAPVGGLLTYTLQIVNRGPIAAYAVVVTNTLPVSVTLVSATPERGTCAANDQTVTCDLVALRRGGLLDVTLVTRVAADVPVGQALVNVAEVWATQADLTPEDNRAVSTVLAEAIADLQTTLWGEARPAANGSVIAGTEYVYHLAVTNFGPSPAVNAQLDSTLPEGARYVSHGTQQGDCTAAGASFWCALGSLAPGQTAQVELVVAVDPLKRGELRYTASARSSERDPQPDNNTAGLGAPVATDVNLNLSYRTVAPEPAIAGADMTYQLVVANTGVSDARAVVVTHTLPANVTVNAVQAGQGTCRVQENQVVCRLGTLRARHAATLDLFLKVNPAMRHPLNHFAVVGSADVDTDARDNSISRRTPLITRADVAVSLESAPEPAIAGKAMVYLAAAQNLGPSDASNVVLTVTLPASVTVQNIQPAQGTCTQTGQEIVCAIGRVPAGVKMPVSIIALVPSDFLSELEAGAGVSGLEPDLDPTNNATTLRSSVVPHADLRITMAGPPDYVIRAIQPQQTLIPYTITVANAGPSIANKVQVVVTLAAGVTFEYANGAVCYPTAKTVLCTVGTLPAGAEHTFVLYVVMAPGISGVMAHRATVSSAAHDPNLSNNSTATAAQAFKEYRLYIPVVVKEGETEEP